MKKDKTKLSKKELEIKTLMEGHSIEVNSSAIWDAIEPQLDPGKEDQRRPIWWIFAGSLAIAIIGFLGWNSIEGRPLTRQDVALFQPLQLTPTNNNTTEVQPSPESEVTQPAPQFQRQNTRSIDKQSRTIEPNYPETSNQQKEIVRTAPSTNPTLQLTATAIDQSLVQPLSEILQSSSISQEADLHNTVSLATTLGSTKVANHQSSSNAHPSDEQQLKAEISVPRSINLLERLDLITIESLRKQQPQIPMIKPLKKKVAAPFFALELGSVLPRFEVTAIGSEGLDRSQFDREIPLLGAMSTLRYGRSYDSGWEWSAGLRWTRLISRYRNTTKSIETSTVPGDEAFRIDESGNTTAISGEVTTTTVNNYDVLWHRNSDYLDLQIGIGKSLWSAGSWSISMGLDATYNLYARHSGYYFEEGQTSITKFENGDSSPYTRQGLGLSPNLSITYEFGDFLIGLAPSYTTQFSNTTNNSNYYQIKNSYYGMQVCTRYRPQ